MGVLREGVCVHPRARRYPGEGLSHHVWAGLGEAPLGRQLFDSFLPCKLLTPLYFFSLHLKFLQLRQ